MASELVFSLWIRRRDTHAANRAYIDSIPVFFDHQTGLLGEPELKDLQLFFRGGSDAGHAARWRVELANAESEVTTSDMRRMWRKRDIALHLVTDFSLFHDSIQRAAGHVKKQDPAMWRKAARTAGFRSASATEIAKFLEKNCEAMDGEIDRMCEIALDQF